MGQSDECREPCDRAISILEELVRTHPENVEYLIQMHELLHAQGLSYLKRQQTEAAAGRKRGPE